MAITRFRLGYRYLSNFYLCQVVFDGMTYRSVEHAYQAAKTRDVRQRRAIQKAPTPGRARKLGRRLKVRAVWDQIKVGVMLRLLESKFSDPRLRAKLLGTRNTLLVEGNNWGDTFWGIDNRTGDGRNMLGLCLMMVRDNLRAGRPSAHTERIREMTARRVGNLQHVSRLVHQHNAKVKVEKLPEITWSRGGKHYYKSWLEQTPTGRKLLAEGKRINPILPGTPSHATLSRKPSR